MAKKKHRQHQTHPSIGMSRLAQSRLAKQKRQKKFTLWASIGVVALVALVVGTGYVTQELIPRIIPLHTTVLTINGKEFNAQYIARMVKYANSNGDLNGAFGSIDTVIEQIKQNEFMKAAGAKLGYTVSDDEINTYLKDNSLDDNSTTRDLVYNNLLSNRIYDNKFKAEVGTSGPQRQALVMLLESAAQADTVKNRLATGENFADIATELSLDSTTVTNKGDMGFHPAGILNGTLSATGLDEKIFAGAANDVSYSYDTDKSKKLGYWVIKITDRKTDNNVQTAKASGILVPTNEQAQDVRQQLVNGGDFTALAKQFSQDAATKDKGGDLGTMTSGTSTGAYISFVFDANTTVGQISQPIPTKDFSTTGAYWLYKIQAVESSRSFSDSDINVLASRQFTDWYTTLKDDPSNVVEVVTLTEAQRDLIAAESLKA